MSKMISIEQNDVNLLTTKLITELYTNYALDLENEIISTLKYVIGNLGDEKVLFNNYHYLIP